MPDTWSDWLGIGGFMLAGIAILIQWLQHRWTKRSFQEQREQKVRAKAIYNPSLGPSHPLWCLQVDVVNVGFIPVYVKSVVLSYSTGKAGRSVAVHEQRSQGNPIAPGDDRYYSLRSDRYEHMEDINTLSRQSVSVKVNTPEKTIFTIEGKDIVWIQSEYDAPAGGKGIVELDDRGKED